MLRERWGAANSTKRTILVHAQPREHTARGLLPRGDVMTAAWAVGDVDMLALMTRGYDTAGGWAPTRAGYYSALLTHGFLTGGT